MEAARVAALKGHDVTLYEKSDRLGGLLNAVMVPDFKKDISRLLDYLSTQMKKQGVKVVLRQEATPEAVIALHPDVMIIAVGSPPEIREPEDAEKGTVLTTVDALLGKAQIGNRVLIVGGGRIGYDVAAHLSGQGKTVTVVTNRPELCWDIEYFARKRLLKICAENKVQFKKNVTVEEIKGKRATIKDREGQRAFIELDNVVFDCRQCDGDMSRQCKICINPRRDLTRSLLNLVPCTRFAGDCVSTGEIESAMHTGFIAGYSI